MIIELEGFQLTIFETDNNLLVRNIQNGKSHYLLNTRFPTNKLEIETIFIASLNLLQ